MMAKKREVVEESLGNPASTIVERLRKKFGIDNIVSGNYILDQPKKILSVCPSFDMNLGGGITEGTLSLISGKPKSGKTTLCLQIAKSAILDNRDVFYLSVEGRFSKANATGIKGLDVDKINVIKSEEGKILSGEDFLEIARDIVYEVPRAMIIIDSTSAISPRNEIINSEITGTGRALAPKMFSDFCKSVSPVIPVNNSIVVGIQHLITNTSGYGAMYSEDGGMKLKFQSDLLLRAKGFTKWMGKADKWIGQQVHWEVIWSNNTGPKVEKFDSYLRFGFGFDEIKEIMDAAIELDIIQKGGAWYTVVDQKLQGEESLWTYLNDNPTVFGDIKHQVYRTLELCE